MTDDRVIVHIERLNPAMESDSHWETFEVPYEQRHSVLTLLHYIYEHYDRELGYRPYTCGRGLCNSCQVSIDGKVRKGCAVPVPPGAEIHVGPANGEVIRDVATILRGGLPEPAVLSEWRQADAGPRGGPNEDV
jgi:succinate dehydrogenase/fumarate reductase-like Fe-S protein